jgi:hypothetical protein
MKKQNWPVDFREWVKVYVRNMFQRRLGKLALVWVHEEHPTTSRVYVEYFGGFRFSCAFDKYEFNLNSRKSLRSLVKARRNMMCLEIEESAKELLKISKRLSR